MTYYEISNRASGHIFGIYEGDTEDEAIRTMLADAGEKGEPSSDLVARELETVDFEHRGRVFRWTWCEPEYGSLLSFDQGIDRGPVDNWPSDERVSAAAGRRVRFFDAGDHPTLPELIYVVEG